MARRTTSFTCPPGCWPEKDICYCPDVSSYTSKMRHPPYTRGVQTLMYVGDDAAPAPTAPAPTGLAALSTTEKIAGGVGLYLALSGKGLLRVAGIATAGWVGYKAFGQR